MHMFFQQWVQGTRFGNLGHVVDLLINYLRVEVETQKSNCKTEGSSLGRPLCYLGMKCKGSDLYVPGSL